jgi:hypothetical protein
MQGTRAKKAGLRSGYPDVFLPYPIKIENKINGIYHAIGDGMDSDGINIKNPYDKMLIKLDPIIYHGLFIELKTKKGKIQKNQQEWLNYLKDARYYATVCYGFEEARDTIVNYLERKL